jgi:hypothetical protein
MKPLVALLKQTIAADPFRCCSRSPATGSSISCNRRLRDHGPQRCGGEGKKGTRSRFSRGARGLWSTSLSNLNVVRT